MAGLYLHIPYCVKKCDYCDFTSFPCKNGVPEAYVDALIREISLVARKEEYPARFDTVFFGGGTPSLLTGEQMRRIMDALREAFPLAADEECSMECNPGTASAENLAAYRAAGINRLSIGLQSANDALLRSVGRIHTFAQFRETLAWARDAGFTNINADVMHGLPGQTQQDYLDTLKTLCDLELQHISAYALTLEEPTLLCRRVQFGEIKLPDEDAVADMQDAGFDFLEQRGYHRYEISNFAQEGRECRHNLNYWKNGEYLGLGVAAHSAIRRKGIWTRLANTESPEEYMRACARNKRPTAQKIRLLPADEMFESVMLGLRLVQGLNRADFRSRFGVDITEAYPIAMEKLRERGWDAESETHFALNKKGLDLQNEALGFFM